MRKQRPTLDGFVPRRTGSQLGERHLNDVRKTEPLTGLQPQNADAPIGLRQSTHGISRGDIDESLNSINIDDSSRKDKKGRRKKGAPKSKLRRTIKWVAILLLITTLCVGGWFVYKTLHAGGSIFQGSILDLIQNQPLKQDANGRSNILVLGTSDDDPGHQGANLTDSMMVLSVDQKNKDAYMISIPRDLWVKYGTACMSGYEGKINVYYSCVGGDGQASIDVNRAALTKTSQFVGNILGLDVQYGVNVNYTVMRQLVNAVGGITVDIEGSGGAPGVMDSNFDWKCGVGDRKVSRAEVLRRCPPNGHYIDYPNGPAYLDAEHALYLAQARGDSAPTYGLGQSNFDREKNQQKIVKAIRDKAMTTGVLTNFGKVTGIIDALGNNLRTTFATAEVRTLISLASGIQDKNLQSISLIDGDRPVMTTGMVSGQSVVEPSAGTYDYSGLRLLMSQTLSNNPVTREKANVVVLNGSGVVGVAQKEADKLTTAGFIVSTVDTAPASQYPDVVVYQIGSGMSATKAKLASLYGVTVKTTAPPVPVTAGTNFIVIFGKDRSTQ